ncbi:MAG TPA: type II toxin-antitoxin system RelE/ParE family toxin [Stellaceae bacterium]|nr:type II toxin-antitoxin system RelE/ParE family toxin [Stellaceae bacterium]
MSRILRMSDAASRDLGAARQWLTQPGAGAAAAKRLTMIEFALRELELYPCRWPRGEYSGVRERPVEGFMIIYRVHPDTDDNRTAGDVLIVRVFGPHQRRDHLSIKK